MDALQGEIAADGGRRRLGSIGRAHQRAGHGHRFTPFPDQGHGGAAGQEFEQWFVKRLALVNRVMLLRQLPAGVNHLAQPVQALLLSGGSTFPRGGAYQGSGFEQDKRALHERDLFQDGEQFTRVKAFFHIPSRAALRVAANHIFANCCGVGNNVSAQKSQHAAGTRR